MTAIRLFARARAQCALGFVALCLAISALVPGGHMLAPGASSFALPNVVPCISSNALAQAFADYSAAHPAAHIDTPSNSAVDHAAMGHMTGASDTVTDQGAHDGGNSPVKASAQCAYASLLLASAILGGSANPLALAVIQPASFVTRAAVFAVLQPDHLRPPLRGPPISQ